MSILFYISACVNALLLIILSFYIKKTHYTNKKKADIRNYPFVSPRNLSETDNEMRQTLNPHLLKNVINSVQSHAYQTYYALDKMSGVLNYILYESRKGFVSLQDELEFARNLININKIKLSPLFELKVHEDLDEQSPLFTQGLLAPLVTVDLIENAFKHADMKGNDSFISIHFEFRGDVFRLRVSNRVSARAPMSKAYGGIGLSALEHRLKIIYGNHFSFEKFEKEEIYYTSLKIDLLGYKTQMLAAR